MRQLAHGSLWASHTSEVCSFFPQSGSIKKQSQLDLSDCRTKNESVADQFQLRTATSAFYLKTLNDARFRRTASEKAEGLFRVEFCPTRTDQSLPIYAVQHRTGFGQFETFGAAVGLPTIALRPLGGTLFRMERR